MLIHTNGYCDLVQEKMEYSVGWDQHFIESAPKRITEGILTWEVFEGFWI